MDKASGVEFRNVGCSYFPQSRVDCHYTLTSDHKWASSDWIGLFKVGWSSVKDYHTFVWALTPADYQEGADVNCCVHFQASYLPKPSSQEYEFVYIDAKGGVCSCSSKFTFCAPKPLEDLVTLEEESHGEEACTDMLLVIPRAELLQSRLQECLRERAELLHVQEAANRQRAKEREEYKRASEAWDRQRKALEKNATRLQDELNLSQEKIREMEQVHKEEQALGKSLAQEKMSLLDIMEASTVRITELEEDIKTLSQRTVERETELERLKEKAKRAGAQRKEEDNERKNLQIKLEQTEGELRSLSKEFQGLRTSLAQRDTSVLQLQNTITTLTQKLTIAHRKEAESEATMKEMRSLRERLNANERAAESLKSDLSAMVAQRDQGQAELHQARLQAAQLTLQLADSSLALREGRAHWAQERQSLQRKSENSHEQLEKLNTEMQRVEERLQEERMERVKLEVELGREKDCNRVQLSETRRELQELKSSVRVAQKEKEQLHAEKQELIEYICQLEQKMGTSAKWSSAPIASTGLPDGALSDSEDENPEALQPPRPPRPLGHYSLCEQGQPDALLLGTPPASPREVERRRVVINQPAPLSSPHQAGAGAGADTLPHSSDSEEESDPLDCSRRSSGEETALLLPEHTDAVLSDLADTSLW
ncbi:calcium-binding and coiled-coil domain-containing protein 1 [Betta splendens]|uniref:Calcium-binding and coiled-coil domain-containing protein 1 n=1 Tax=Betta splendens TaxID=158456 RepID=A0A6P7MWK9_BETSP|nr:calcium-binding and coiled-coil domain-containing protein 1 [Betta splendens]XP_055366224.1 calcium-binding and coiled-coil domain-containing protein 1 [Betta splendens]XP_055366225.1 calcium-binding and coiled-coil domain-containing protein 1 [Betta splendens]